MLEMKPVLIGQALKIEALERGEVLGSVKCRLGEDKLYIEQIECDDEFIYDGLVRTALNSAAQNGIDKAEFLLQDRELLNRLRFTSDCSNEIESIEQFLTKCKKCTN